MLSQADSLSYNISNITDSAIFSFSFWMNTPWSDSDMLAGATLKQLGPSLSIDETTLGFGFQADGSGGDEFTMIAGTKTLGPVATNGDYRCYVDKILVMSDTGTQAALSLTLFKMGRFQNAWNSVFTEGITSRVKYYPGKIFIQKEVSALYNQEKVNYGF